MQTTDDDKNEPPMLPQTSIQCYDTSNVVLAAVRPVHIIRLFFGVGRPPTSNWLLIGLYHLITVAIILYLCTTVTFVIVSMSHTGISLNTGTVLYFAMLAYLLQALISIIVGLRLEYCGRPSIVAAWERASADNLCLVCSRKLKVVTWLCVGVLAVFVPGTIALTIGMTAAGVPGMNDLNQVYFLGRINYVYPFLQLFLVVPWGATQASYATLVYAVKYAFEGFRKRIDHSTELGANLERWSASYTRLLDLLHEVNHQLRFYAAAMIATVLPCIVCILFQFFGRGNVQAGVTAQRVESAFWLCGMTFLLFVICSASVCNRELERVFKAFNRKFGEDSQKLDARQEQKAAILLQRMSVCRSFGITAWEMFAITPNTINTLLSIIISYLVILVTLSI